MCLYGSADVAHSYRCDRCGDHMGSHDLTQEKDGFPHSVLGFFWGFCDLSRGKSMAEVNPRPANATSATFSQC